MKYEFSGIKASDFYPLPIKGDTSAEATYITSLSSATDNCLTFYSGNDTNRLASIEASIVIASDHLQASINQFKSSAIVFTPNPKYSFIDTIKTFFSDKFSDKLTKVNCNNISKYAFIESNVQYGKDVEIYPNATLFNCVALGDNCVVQSGSVIGGSGLGDVFFDGIYHRFVHLGGVKIESNVSIGVNSTILRGMLEDTVVGEGTKIGSNVSIGHSSIIGKNVYISSGVNIGGACIIEDNCWLSPGVTLTDHINVGVNTKIGTGAVLVKDAMPNSFYLGNPARKLPR